MPVARISTYVKYPFYRQLPADIAKVGGWTFVSQPGVMECDAWIVFDDAGPIQTICPHTNTLLLIGEPPSVRRYPQGFIDQFATVVTCGGHHFRGTGIIEKTPPLPWWYGIGFAGRHELATQQSHLTYQDIAAAQPQKSKLLSVICSNRRDTPGHRSRLAFVQRLRQHFGLALDVFGFGFKPILDKRQAIDDYKYHIVLENSSWPHYWSEKLADAYLGWALPLYHGCPNVADYFPEKAFVGIDPEDHDRSIALIEVAMKNQLWEANFAAIRQAREMVLDTYNFFPFAAALLTPPSLAGPRSQQDLLPQVAFAGRFTKLRATLRHKLRRGWGLSHRIPFLSRI